MQSCHTYPCPNLFLRCWIDPRHLRFPVVIIHKRLHSASHSSIECVVKMTERSLEMDAITSHINLRATGSIPMYIHTAAGEQIAFSYRVWNNFTGKCIFLWNFLVLHGFQSLYFTVPIGFWMFYKLKSWETSFCIDFTCVNTNTSTYQHAHT